MNLPRPYACARPRIQRAFLAWLAGNKKRWRYEPYLIKRTDKVLGLGLHGLPEYVRLVLTRFSFSVCLLTSNDEFLDYLEDRDGIPVAMNGRRTQPWLAPGAVSSIVGRDAGKLYCCGFCLLAGRPNTETFVSREQFFCNHLFEPVLAYVNERLWQVVSPQ